MRYALNGTEGTLMPTFRTTKEARLLTIDALHRMIVEGRYRKEIEAIVEAHRQGSVRQVRGANGSTQEVQLCDWLKKQLPYYVAQADVRERRLLAHARVFTGYAPVDIDHLTADEVDRVMRVAAQLAWVKEAHRSSRGEGVHLFVAMGVIEVDRGQPGWEKAYSGEYKRRYQALSKAISAACGVQVDGQCNDVLRGFFMSADERAFLRPDDEVVAFDYPDEDPRRGPAIGAVDPVAPVAATALPTAASLQGAQFKLLSDYLVYHSYRPSERHRWWVDFARYLKYKRIAPESLLLYRQLMQVHLTEQGLIRADDPLLRSENEVQDAMEWGYAHSEAPQEPDEGFLSSENVWNGQASDREELDRLHGIRLPLALRASLAPQPERVKLPTLCGIFPLLGAYASGVTVRYCDGKTQRLNLLSSIVAEQGGLKSGVKDVLAVWKQPLLRSDQEVRQKEDDYKQLKLTKKANEKLPPPPKDVVREVPPTISCSALLKRLKQAKGLHLYSFCEEIDTVRKTNGAGSWSSKYDVYRLAFDNGEWGQDYNSDSAESGVVAVAYNWTFMGTPQAMMKCFAQNGAVENGLTGRVWHAVIPPSRYAHMPKYKPMEPQHKEAILNGVEILRKAEGFIDTPRLRKAMERWCDSRADEAGAAQDEVVDTYRKRAAAIGFRTGVIFHLLEQGERWLNAGKELADASFLREAKESKHCVQFALLVADHVLKYQCLLYGAPLLKEKQNVASKSGGYRSRNKNLFEELGSDFSFDELKARRPQMEVNALRTMLSRWKKEQLIVCVDRNAWRKKV